MSKKLAKLLVLILSVPLISYRNIPDNDTVNIPVSSLNASMDSLYFSLYRVLRSDVSKPDYEVFKKALTGFFNLKA